MKRLLATALMLLASMTVYGQRVGGAPGTAGSPFGRTIIVPPGGNIPVALAQADTLVASCSCDVMVWVSCGLYRFQNLQVNDRVTLFLQGPCVVIQRPEDTAPPSLNFALPVIDLDGDANLMGDGFIIGQNAAGDPALLVDGAIVSMDSTGGTPRIIGTTLIDSNLTGISKTSAGTGVIECATISGVDTPARTVDVVAGNLNVFSSSIGDLVGGVNIRAGATLSDGGFWFDWSNVTLAGNYQKVADIPHQDRNETITGDWTWGGATETGRIIFNNDLVNPLDMIYNLYQEGVTSHLLCVGTATANDPPFFEFTNTADPFAPLSELRSGMMVAVNGRLSVGSTTQSGIFTVSAPGYAAAISEDSSANVVGRTITLNTGAALANWRENRLQASTFVGVAGGAPESVTDADTLRIEAAPVQGANVTLTAAHALHVAGGTSLFDGPVVFGGGIGGGFTGGSVIFSDAGGNLDEDNGSFFWNDTLNFLGVGTGAPAAVLDVDSAALTGLVAERQLLRVAGPIFGLASGTALATWEHVRFAGPAIQGVLGAPVESVTTAATVYIEGPPTDGAGCSITTPLSLWVDSGNAQFDGTVAAVTVTGANVTSGANPGHTHTGASLSGLDISDDTNLTASDGLELVGDDVSFVRTATLVGDPAMGAGEWVPSTTGIIFEGSSADGIETLLVPINPTVADKTISLPDASGTVAVSATAPVTLSALGAVGLTQNAGTDVTADLEEETHAAEHSAAGGDAVSVENLATAGGAGTAPLSGGAGTLAMADVIVPTEIDTKAEMDGLMTDGYVLGDGANGGFFNDESVIVGADVAETLANAGFSLAAGNLFVTGTAGIEGNVYTDGAFIVGASTTYGDGSINASGGTVSFNSDRITTVGDPVDAQDVATKAYVDAVASGLTPKDSMRAATTGALPAYTYAANVLTATLVGALPAQDGVTLVLNDRLLVKDEAGANEKYNGLWYLSQVGDGLTQWKLTRTTDADISAEVTAGLYTFVTEGTASADAGFVLTTNDPIVLNTTALAFTQFSGAGQIIAGNALSKTGNTLDVNVDGATIEVNADALRLMAMSGDVTTAAGSLVTTIQANSVALTADTTGNYAAGDAEAGNALTGDSATGFFSAGTLEPTIGGTGLTSYVLGDILYSSVANTLARLAGNITATKNFLTQTGTGAVSAAPAWGTIADADVPATLSRDTEAPAAGDVTGSLSAGYQVTSDSHDHTNLTGTTGLTWIIDSDNGGAVVGSAGLVINGTTDWLFGSNAAATGFELFQGAGGTALALGRTTDTGASILSIVDGGADNLPGVAGFYSDAGTGYGVFVSTAGDLRIKSGTAVVDDETDGSLLYRSGGTDVAVADGGTGLSDGTSGGVLGYTAVGTLASSVALTANALVLGGGAGATPTPLGSLGTTTTVLHGNAAGAPTFGAVVDGDFSGQLTAGKGGTGDDTSAVTGVPRITAGNWTYDAGVSHLAASTSAALAGVLSDETGTGLAVFATDPALAGNPTAPTPAANDNDTSIATTAFVTSSTTTFTNKSYNAASAGNALTMIQYMPLTTGGANLVAGKPDRAADGVSLDFDGAADETAEWKVVEMPADWDSTYTMRIKIAFENLAADAGQTLWILSCDCEANDGALGDAYTVTETGYALNGIATIGDLSQGAFAVVDDQTNVAAGESCIFRLTRNADTDANNSDVRLRSVVVEYQVIK